MLHANECAALAPATIDLLYDWHRHGFLADTPDTSLPPPPGLPREERLDTIAALIRAQDDVIALARRHIKVFDIDLSWGGWNAAARCEALSARSCGASRRALRHHRARHALDRSVRRAPDGAARALHAHAMTIYRTGASARKAMDPLLIVDDDALRPSLPHRPHRRDAVDRQSGAREAARRALRRDLGIGRAGVTGKRARALTRAASSAAASTAATLPRTIESSGAISTSAR